MPSSNATNNLKGTCSTDSANATVITITGNPPLVLLNCLGSGNVAYASNSETLDANTSSQYAAGGGDRVIGPARNGVNTLSLLADAGNITYTVGKLREDK